MERGELAGLLAYMAILPIVFLIVLLPTIFFLLTLQRALGRCSSDLRTMTPGLVWLSIIPVFNLVWSFFIVNALAESLHREFERRGITAEPQPARSIGMAYAILMALAIIPLLGVLTACAGIVCWILYWVKIAEYSAKIAQPWGGPAAATA